MNAPLLTASRSLLASALRPAAAPPSSALASLGGVPTITYAVAMRLRVAALLATALKPLQLAAVRRAHADASRAMAGLVDLRDLSPEARDLARILAERVRRAMLREDGVDRTALLVAAVRGMLDGAPDCFCDLDRTLRDSAAWEEHPVTAAHEALAAAIIAREVRL